MVRQKSEPNKIDGRKRDSIEETKRDERNSEEDEGKPIVSIQQQHDGAQEEDVDRSFHEWEMHPQPQEKYVRHMMKIDEKAFRKSNARFWFNVKKIEDKYARRDPDKEIIYDFKKKKAFVPKAITDEEALDQMQKLNEMPEFGESVLSCFDPSTQEEDSPGQKKGNRQRDALNKIFDMQYESCPLALLPKEPTLQLPPPPVRLPIEGVPTETETRKRTIVITGEASEVSKFFSSTNNIFALFADQKPALTGDTNAEKESEDGPIVEQNVEQPHEDQVKCIKEEPIDFPVTPMMNNADLLNRRSSRRKTIENAFSDGLMMRIANEEPKDFGVSTRQPAQSVQKRDDSPHYAACAELRSMIDQIINNGAADLDPPTSSNRRSSRRNTIDNDFNGEMMNVLKEEPEDLALTTPLAPTRLKSARRKTSDALSKEINDKTNSNISTPQASVTEPESQMIDVSRSFQASSRRKSAPSKLKELKETPKSRAIEMDKQKTVDHDLSATSHGSSQRKSSVTETPQLNTSLQLLVTSIFTGSLRRSTRIAAQGSKSSSPRQYSPELQPSSNSRKSPKTKLPTKTPNKSASKSRRVAGAPKELSDDIVYLGRTRGRKSEPQVRRKEETMQLVPVRRSQRKSAPVKRLNTNSFTPSVPRKKAIMMKPSDTTHEMPSDDQNFSILVSPFHTNKPYVTEPMTPAQLLQRNFLSGWVHDQRTSTEGGNFDRDYQSENLERRCSQIWRDARQRNARNIMRHQN